MVAVDIPRGTGRRHGFVAYLGSHGFDESKIPVGVLHLERHCQRIYDLRLAATIGNTLCRRRSDDDGFLFSPCPAHVADLHRLHGSSLLADETRLLIRTN